MKNRAIKVAILAGSTILLAACDNGGGGGDEPVPLETKSDALRELSVSIGGAGALVEYLDIPSGAKAARVKAASAKAAGLPDCDTQTGSVTYDNGTKDRDFKLLDPPVSGLRVDFDAQVRDKYEQHDCYGEDQSSSELFRADGALEEGTAGTESASYYYYSAGSGDKPAYDLSESRENGQLVFRQLLEYLGTVEKVETEDGIVQALSLRLKREFFELEERDTKQTYVLGDCDKPLRVTTTSGAILLDGSYSYSTNFSDCSGGQVQMSTPSEDGILFSDSRPSGGELLLRSGGSSARFTFNNDGGATLVINGGAGIDVTPAEVEAALVAESSPCAEENNPL